MAGSRSGRMSTIRRHSRSQIRVPYRRPHRQAQSSIPITRSCSGVQREAARTLRRNVSLLTGSSSRSANACVGLPPNIRPSWSTRPCSREVRRAWGLVTSEENCSAKIAVRQAKSSPRGHVPEALSIHADNGWVPALHADRIADRRLQCSLQRREQEHGLPSTLPAQDSGISVEVLFAPSPMP